MLHRNLRKQITLLDDWHRISLLSKDSKVQENYSKKLPQPYYDDMLASNPNCFC